MTETHWLADEIERLVDGGYRPIPIKPNDKAPGKYSCGQWVDMSEWTRFCARQPTDREIAEWSAYPPCGVGIATGNVVAFDIDILDDAMAIRVEQLLRQIAGDTPAIRFGRRPKRLLVYRVDKPFRSRNFGPVEILCEGRQFVAYGIHPVTGSPYNWGFESLAQIDRDSLPVVDERIVDEFLSRLAGLLPTDVRLTYRRDTISHFAKQPAPIATLADAMRFVSPAEGQHYDDWLAMGMALHEATGGDADAYDLWEAWSSRSSKYDPARMQARWSSFGKYPGERHGAGFIYDDARRNGWTTSLPLTTDAEAAALVDTGPFMANFLAASRAARSSPTSEPVPELEPVWTVPAGEPGWLRDLDGGLRLFVDFVRDQSHRDQPELALAAALPIFGTLAGRRYQNETGLLTNVYTVALAYTGSGKETPVKMGREIFQALNEAGMDGGDDFASGSALVSALYDNPSTYFALDEFGKMFASASNQRTANSHEADKIRKMLSLYSASQRTFTSTARADRATNKQKVVVHPCLSIFGPTAPEPFWAGLSSMSVDDGMIGRMIVFEPARQYPPQVRPVRKSIPSDLLDNCANIVAGANGHITFPMGNGPEIRPQPFIVALESDCAPLDDEMMAEIDRLQNAFAGTKANAIYARVRENILKVAMVKAISRSPSRPRTTKVDYIWARDLVMDRAEYVIRKIDLNVSDNEHEATKKKVWRIIDEAGSGGITQNELTRRTQFLRDKRERLSILDDLLEAQDIRAMPTQSSGAGRPLTTYYSN